MTAAAEESAPLPTEANINDADAATLAAVLEGVSVVKAEAIIRYRDMHGGFATVEELANVSGIGMSTVDRNLERIKLGEG